MGVSGDDGRIGIECDQLLAKIQQALFGITPSRKYENRGEVRMHKRRKLQKARGRSSSGKSMAGCWKTIIPEPTRLKIGKIFGCHVYEKVAGETETAPFLSRDWIRGRWPTSYTGGMTMQIEHWKPLIIPSTHTSIQSRSASRVVTTNKIIIPTWGRHSCHVSDPTLTPSVVAAIHYTYMRLQIPKNTYQPAPWYAFMCDIISPWAPLNIANLCRHPHGTPNFIPHIPQPVLHLPIPQSE